MNKHSKFHYFTLLCAVVALQGFFAISSVPAADDAASPPGNIVHLKRFVEEVDAPWKHFLAQNGVELKNGETYILTFWAKASTQCPLKISMKDNQTWEGVGSQATAEVSTDWQKIELPLSGEKSEPGRTRLEFHYGNGNSGDIWIADIRVRPEGTDEKSPDNLITNGRFEDQLNRWYTEGQNEGGFLVEVQSLADANATAQAK